MEQIGNRCSWAEQSEWEREYHDQEWGRPVHDDRKLFEMLILEGMQAGLSWSLILKKRENFRQAFDSFDPAIIRDYDSNKVEELLQNEGIIRNRLKINSVITNAKAYFTVQEKYGSLDAFLWSYVEGQPIVNHWESLHQTPVNSELSDRLSKDLKKLGFKFVGTTIIYSFMQAVGMINDHVTGCYLHDQLL